MQSSQKQFFYRLLLAVLCAAPRLLAAQQTVRTLANGDKVVVRSDGRMTYFNGDPVPDSLRYPIIKVDIEPLEGGPVRPTEDDVYRIAERRAQLAAAAAEQAARRAKSAEENLAQIKEEQAGLALTAGEEERKLLDKRLRLAARIRVESAEEARTAAATAATTRELTGKGTYVQAYNQERRQRREQSEKRSAQVVTGRTELLPASRNGLRRPAGRGRHGGGYAAGAALRLAFDGPDPELDGRYRRQGERELLFTHTDDRLRPFLKDREYLSCSAFLHSTGGYRYVTLEFTFAYPNAAEAYGMIEKNSLLTVRLLNGEFVNFRSGTLATGSYNTRTELLTYSVFYPIDRAQLSLLKNSEVDFIRVFWSSGFRGIRGVPDGFFPAAAGLCGLGGSAGSLKYQTARRAASY